MNYCKNCVMPDTRPGIIFDENGICQGCKTHEAKKEINWKLRRDEFEILCNKYRDKNKEYYDCIIAVSGGKDSHVQVHWMKEVMKMNPLLVSVEDNFTMTEAGKHNLKNLSERFSCQIISLKPDIKKQKIVMRYTFEKYGKPTWYIDRLIYTYPLFMASKLNIPLLVYGENISYEYGGDWYGETYSARNQIKNGVALDIPYEKLLGIGLRKEDLLLIKQLEDNKMNELDPMYLSYFIPWNSIDNYEWSKRNGFHDLSNEWDRTHHVENFDQIDSIAYLVHSWLKYPKFGHASATDYVSRFIRYGILSREEGINLVKKKDHNLDKRCIVDFCDFLGYTESEFWNIIDNHYNKDIFKNVNGKWRIK
ncbi:MAG: N-acetyl sugar amidotransferase [Thermoplasmata archaeon]|nr:MAG: N-acetyl sugar amidotransferase [Thermoplasmata archaeon]